MIENINKVVIDDEFNGEKKQHIITHIGKIEPIDEIDASILDNDNFKQNYFRNNKPLVIRNALKFYDCGTAYSNWSLEYLTEKCGSNKVHVRRNTMKDEYKTGKAYLVQEIEFRQYVSDLLKDNKTSKNSYLAVQNLKKAFPQIDNELKMPPFYEKPHAGPFLWIARSGHYEYTHMDPDDNLLIVLKGRKLVRLYGCDVHSMHPNKLGSKGRTIQSQINCDQLQEDLSPEIVEKYRNVTCSYCLLKESDILYFPAFWWHQVKSPELTISVNVFYGDNGENNFITKLLNSPQRGSLFYWINNIIQQNIPHPSFPRILLNLKPTLKSFLIKQWHEVLDDSQLEILSDSIIKYFNLSDRLKELTNSEFDVKSKNPPNLRIRGLVMRNSYNDKKYNDKESGQEEEEEEENEDMNNNDNEKD